MTQKDAVFNVVTSVLGSNFTSGMAVVLDKTTRATINAQLIQKFTNGEIDLSDDAKTKLANITELKAYVSGLVSNWLKKDARLNGGVKGISKPRQSKGSPVASVVRTDPTLKAMKTLLASKKEASEIAEIQLHIDKRINELTTSNVVNA